MQQLFAQLSKESFVYGLSATAAKLVGFILVPIYTRALSQSDFGILDLVSTGTAILSSTLILGLDAATAIAFYQADDLGNRRAIASTFLYFALALSLLVCSLLFMAAQPLAEIAFGDPAFTPYVQLGVATVPFAICVTVFLNISRLVRLPVRYLLISAGNLLCTSLLVVIAILTFNWGVQGVLLATLAGSSVFSLVGWLVTRREYGSYFSTAILRRLLALGLPLASASVALWVINFSNRWFLLHLTGSAEQTGIYALATRLSAPVVLVVTAFQIAWVPFSLSIARHESALPLYARTLTLFLAGTFAVLLPLTLWAGPIVALFSTDAYLPAAQIIALVGLSSIASGVYYIVATGVTLLGKTLHIGWTTMVAMVISIAFNILMIPPLGILGAAIATLAANLVPVVLLYFLAQRIYRIPYDLKRTGLLVTLGAATLLVASLMRMDNSVVDFALRLALLAGFFVALVLLGIIRGRDVREIGRMLKARAQRGVRS